MPVRLLRPLSAIYSLVTRARLTAYRRGWFSVSRLPVPVISVGNLTTGGTGKTPLVEWVCHVLANEGTPAKRVCILTRGYARPDPKSQLVVSDGKQILAEARLSGDEPYLLAKNLLGIAAVICNPDRVAAGKWAMENLRSEVFVLDDGFQHQRLQRDLDIVTVDATNPWGGGRLLPYGRLREPVAGLSRAGCIVITRSDQVEEIGSLKHSIRQLATEGRTRSSAPKISQVPVFSSRMVTEKIRTLDDHIADFDKQAPFAAFCGIGNPGSFFEHLRREGVTPVLSRSFLDHHHYTPDDLADIEKSAESHGAKALVTTAKDAVKLPPASFRLPCFVLDVQISIDDDTRLREMIRNACLTTRDSGE
jgi:tetraacyldisaccharide 4'-kinase